MVVSSLFWGMSLPGVSSGEKMEKVVDSKTTTTRQSANVKAMLSKQKPKII